MADGEGGDTERMDERIKRGREGEKERAKGEREGNARGEVRETNRMRERK